MAKYAIKHKYIEFFMPKIINVSATFDNCAFHSIAAHLLAYKKISDDKNILNKIFNHPKGDFRLTALFNGRDDFELFFKDLKTSKAKRFDDKHSNEGEAFEKVLIFTFGCSCFILDQVRAFL